MVHPSCAGYSIAFTDDAKRDLRRLDRQIIERIFEKIKKLISHNADNLNIKKLKSNTPFYRLKVGDYRVIYCIHHEVVIVNIVAVGHRKDIYDLLLRRLSRT